MTTSSSTFDITTCDGLRLLGRRWPLGSTPRTGRALLVHGVGEHSGRYDEVAAVMTSLGIEVVSYDQRGFGQSEGKKGMIPADATLVEDAATIFKMVCAEAPDEKAPFLIAHSMGGAIAAYAVTSGAIMPRGLALSSPAIEPRLTKLEEQLLRMLLEHNPDATLDSLIFPNKVTRDKKVQEMIEHDPLMHRMVTPRLIVSILDQGEAVFSDAERISVPTLLLVAGSDKVVNQDQTGRFAQKLEPSLRTCHFYPELFHEVFNEIPADRQQVLTDFSEWLKAQLSAAPPSQSPDLHRRD